MTKSTERYFKIKQIPGTPAQKHLDVARRLGKMITPLVALGILLVLQPFSKPISDWLIDYGWIALWSSYLLLNIPAYLFYFRRSRELRAGYSTWDREDLIENKDGRRIVLVDADTGLILRVAGQAHLVPVTQSETRLDRIRAAQPKAIQVELPSRALRERSSRGSLTHLRKSSKRDLKLDEVIREIIPVD